MTTPCRKKFALLSNHHREDQSSFALPFPTQPSCFRPFPAKSNDSNWIRSPKSMFLHFFSIFAKCQKSPKVGTVLGPFGPKTQNTTHQSSITPLLHSFYHILSSYKKLLKTVKPFSRYSTLKNRVM